MWTQMLLLLVAAVCALTLPAANEYGDCQHDDLYESLEEHGFKFCKKLLDSPCYSDISTPIEYATYDPDTLTSYCSCVFESCHHESTTTVELSTTEATSETVTTASPVSTIPQNSTSDPTSDNWPTETATLLPGPPWSSTNTTLLTPTASSVSNNVTITIIPMPTLSTTRTISFTIVPGNTTTSPFGNTTTSALGNTTTIIIGDTTISTHGNTTTTFVRDTTTSTPESITTTSQVVSSTSTISTPTPIQAANFTGVRRGPAPAAQTCHHLPEARDGTPHVATLQNEEIRQRNLSLAFPIVGSIDFDSDNTTPLYLSVMDAAKGSHRIDVSSSTAVTIFDSKNDSLKIDQVGIHFSTSNCNLTVSFFIDNMYAQLAQQSHEMCALGPKTMMATEQDFIQTLFLKDQCNEPVQHVIRQYPDLRLGDDHCFSVGTDDSNGTWVFSCPWYAEGSNVQKCVSSLERNAIEFLLYNPFNGGCADVSSVVTLLEASAADLITGDSLKQELYHQVGRSAELRAAADDTVVYYLQLWEMLKSTLSRTRGRSPGRGSNLKRYLDTYNAYRSFAGDACSSLNGSQAPAVLSLRAGSSTIPSLASFAAAPAEDKPIPAKVQDPAKAACCPNGGVSATDPDTGECAYPPTALVPGTSCVCGRTAGGAAVAFNYRQCDNFPSQCEADSDCSQAGYAGYLCLIGSCCGKGVCFDPFECSRAEVPLVSGKV